MNLTDLFSNLSPFAAFSGWAAAIAQFFIGKRGADATQYKNLSERLTNVEKRSDECEKDRFQLRKMLVRVEALLAAANITSPTETE